MKQRARRNWCRPTVPAKFWRLKHWGRMRRRPVLVRGVIGKIDRFNIIVSPSFSREIVMSTVGNPERW